MLERIALYGGALTKVAVPDYVSIRHATGPEGCEHRLREHCAQLFHLLPCSSKFNLIETIWTASKYC
ncbi:hypothetical protein CIC12_00305 [Burkholderia sp. SG-MS1]|nr:hypothetical protein [Paraburkholderia sp. SG-MS1]